MNFDFYFVEKSFIFIATLKGTPLVLDFFLDEEEDVSSSILVGQINQQKTAEPTTAQSQTSGGVSGSIDKIRGLISPDLVKNTNGVYWFKLSDSTPSDWYLDLKNGNGSLTSGSYDGKVNVTMTMNSEVFNDMVSGKLKATAAFMSGKLKIKGDMGLAMKLEKVMNSLKPKL